MNVSSGKLARITELFPDNVIVLGLVVVSVKKLSVPMAVAGVRFFT